MRGWVPGAKRAAIPLVIRDCTPGAHDDVAAVVTVDQDKLLPAPSTSRPEDATDPTSTSGTVSIDGPCP